MKKKRWRVWTDEGMKTVYMTEKAYDKMIDKWYKKIKKKYSKPRISIWVR